MDATPAASSSSSLLSDTQETSNALNSPTTKTTNENPSNFSSTLPLPYLVQDGTPVIQPILMTPVATQVTQRLASSYSSQRAVAKVPLFCDSSSVAGSSILHTNKEERKPIVVRVIGRGGRGSRPQLISVKTTWSHTPTVPSPLSPTFTVEEESAHDSPNSATSVYSSEHGKTTIRQVCQCGSSPITESLRSSPSICVCNELSEGQKPPTKSLTTETYIRPPGRGGAGSRPRRLSYMNEGPKPFISLSKTLLKGKSKIAGDQSKNSSTNSSPTPAPEIIDSPTEMTFPISVNECDSPENYHPGKTSRKTRTSLIKLAKSLGDLSSGETHDRLVRERRTRIDNLPKIVTSNGDLDVTCNTTASPSSPSFSAFLRPFSRLERKNSATTIMTHRSTSTFSDDLQELDKGVVSETWDEVLNGSIASLQSDAASPTTFSFSHPSSGRRDKTLDHIDRNLSTSFFLPPRSKSLTPAHSMTSLRSIPECEASIDRSKVPSITTGETFEFKLPIKANWLDVVASTARARANEEDSEYTSSEPPSPGLQTWTGEWNRSNIRDVIRELRLLR